MKTKLNYLKQSEAKTDKAVVLSVQSEKIDGREHYKIVLDQTIFYPQGGGQPSDLGYIKRSSAEFEIEKVYYNREVDEIVHYGYIKQGSIKEGERVTLHLDYKNRLLNSRYHSAGHIIDIAVNDLDLNWEPVKGYHFPRGAYVEYKIAEKVELKNREDLLSRIEKISNSLINKNLTTEILTVAGKEELTKYCDEIPNYIPKEKPVRIVRYEDFSFTPCRGTHVINSQQVGEIIIRKLKFKGNNVRISYKLV